MTKEKQKIIERILDPQTADDYGLSADLNEREIQEFQMMSRKEDGTLKFPDIKEVEEALKRDKYFRGIAVTMGGNAATCVEFLKKLHLIEKQGSA